MLTAILLLAASYAIINNSLLEKKNKELESRILSLEEQLKKDHENSKSYYEATHMIIDWAKSLETALGIHKSNSIQEKTKKEDKKKSKPIFSYEGGEA